MTSKEKYSLDEIGTLDELLKDNNPLYNTQFTLFRLNAAIRVLSEDNAIVKSSKELLDAGWLPFMGFYLKLAWGRIIFHDCLDGVRPYVVG